MQEIRGNIWDYHDQGFPIIITTNGNINHHGENVMGRGIALQAKHRFPKLPKFIGEHIKRVGNVVKYFPEYNLFSFPTKHNYWENSDLELILESTDYLVRIVGNLRYTCNGLQPLDKYSKIYLVRPGCENGKLIWKDVSLILENYLDDSYFVVNKI